MSKFNKIVSAAAGAAALAATSAHAALPTGVDTAITGVTTDGSTLVGAMAVGGATVFLIAKLLRKFGIFL